MNQFITRISLALLVALACGSTSLKAIGVGILNPSFESGLTSWDHDGSVYILGPPNQGPIGTAGTHSANMGSFNLPGAFLAQNLTLLPGTAYVLNFDSAANAVAVIGKVGMVRVEVFDSMTSVLASDTFTDISPGNLQGPLGFSTRSLGFTTPVDSGSVRLKFSDVSPDNGLAVDENIDNIRLTAVPEPTSTALLLMGAGALLAYRRAKR